MIIPPQHNFYLALAQHTSGMAITAANVSTILSQGPAFLLNEPSR